MESEQTDLYEDETLIHSHFSHFLRIQYAHPDSRSHPCPVTCRYPSLTRLSNVWTQYNVRGSSTISSPLPALGSIKPSLAWLRPPLLLSWIAVYGKNRCAGEEDRARHVNCGSLSSDVAAVRLHEPPPGDSDLHGQQRCDIIYDIYNILDPLAGIMK